MVRQNPELESFLEENPDLASLIKKSPYLNSVFNGCRTTMDTSPGIRHEEACISRYRLKQSRLHNAWICETISLMVDVLEEAGDPLDEWETHKRVKAIGNAWHWGASCDRALAEGIVGRRNRTMLCLCARLPARSPEETAEIAAFDKAQSLGVIVRSGDDFVFTDLRDRGLLTADEARLAERSMRRRNAIDVPEMLRLYGLLRHGKITRDELNARMDKMTGDAGEPVPQVMAPKAKTRA